MEQPKFGADFNAVGEGKGYLSVIAERKNNASKPNKVAQNLQVLNSVVDTSTKLINIKNTEDANTAVADAKSLVYSDDFINAPATDKVSMLHDYTDNITNKSPAYQEAFISSVSPTYATAEKKAFTERQSAAINMASNVINADSDSLIMQGKDPEKAIEESINKYADTYSDLHLNKGELKQAALFGRLDQVKEHLYSGDTEAAREMYDDTLKLFSSKKLLGTTSSKSRMAIAEKKREIALLFKEQQGRDKSLAYSKLAEIVNNGYRAPISEFTRWNNIIAPNEYVAKKQELEYQKKHEEVIGADVFMAEKPVGIPNRGHLPEGNSMLKQRRQPEVTKALVGSFEVGDLHTFITVANNEPEFLKDAGQELTMKFNSLEKPEEIQQFMYKFNVASNLEGGATALRQVVSDKEYGRMYAISNLAIAFPDKNMTELRADIRASASKTESMKLQPDKLKKMYKYATELGTESDNYLNVMRNVMVLNPELGEKEYKHIADRFKKVLTKDKKGRVDNEGMALSPTRDRNLIDGKAVGEDIQKALPETTKERIWMPNNVVIAKDNLDGFVAIKDMTNVIQESEKETEQKLLEDHNDLVSGKAGVLATFNRNIRSGVRDLVDNFVPTIMSIPDAITSIVQDSSDNTQLTNEHFNPDEAIHTLRDELRKEKARNITTLPDVANNTLTLENQEKVEQALDRNKQKQVVASKALEHIETTNGIVDFSSLLKNPTPTPETPKHKEVVDTVFNDLKTLEGRGDNVTNVPTGNLGMTLSTKKMLEEEAGKSLTDEEAAYISVNGIVSKVESLNSDLSPTELGAIADTIYNLGTGALDWESFKKYLNNPNPRTFAGAVLTKVYTNHNTSLGLARRRAIQFNKVYGNIIGNITRDDKTGNITYYDTEGREFFPVENLLNK